MKQSLQRFPYWLFNVINLINSFLDFFQARAESELHLVTAAFSRSSTKDVATTVVHEGTTIGLGAPWHPTTIETENGATVLVNVFCFCLFFFFHVFDSSVSSSVVVIRFVTMREDRVRFHARALSMTGLSILARSAKRGSVCTERAETLPYLRVYNFPNRTIWVVFGYSTTTYCLSQ